MPIVQAGFRPNQNCEDEALSPTTFIERGYDQRLKTGAVFMDLTGAYESDLTGAYESDLTGACREGLTYNSLEVTRCKTMSSLLKSMLSNRVLQISL